MEAAALFGSGLVAGLVAGTASCTAVQGGLLVGLAGARDPAAPWGFPAGRLASCTVVGALLGLAGSAGQPPPAGLGGRVGGVAGAGDRPALGWRLGGGRASDPVVGALVGLAGSAVKPPPQARAVLLVAAGLMVIAFAVRLYRRCGCEPTGHRF